MDLSPNLEAVVTALESQATKPEHAWKYTPPFGYTYSRHNGVNTVIIDHEAAEVVVACYRLAAAGYSLRQILAMLTDQGLLPCHGMRLGRVGISRILNESVYHEPAHDGYEPIISRELFEATQEKLAERRY